MKIPLLLLLLFCLTSTSCLLGQTPFFINYDTNDGLPSSESYQVFCASDGRMWCTTDRGVAVYNGYEFTSYSIDHGLGNNTNFRLFEDSKQRIWFTGLNKSVSYYEDGQFSKAWFQDSINKYLYERFIHAPIEDEKGRLLFFGMDHDFSNSNIIRVSPENDAVEILDFGKLIRDYSYLQGPIIDLVIINKQAIPRSDNFGFRMPFIQKGDGWIGITAYGLIELNKDGEIVKRLDISNAIEKAYMDSRGQLWVASHKGLYHFPTAKLSEKPNVYLPNSLISDITEDFENNIWVSTHEGGLKFFPHFKMSIIENSEGVPLKSRILCATALKHHIYFGTSRDHILAVGKDKKVEVVCGAGERNLHFPRSYKTGNLIQYRYYTVKENKNEDFFWYRSKISGIICKELGNGYFVSGYGYGYTITEPNGNRHFSRQFKNSFTERVDCIEEEKNGDILLGTVSGVVRINSEDYFSHEKPFVGVSCLEGRIMDIKNDFHDDNLWIATMGNGLVYKTRDSIYQILAKDGLLSNLINCIFVQDENTVWAGTNQGLNRLSFDWKGGRFNINSIEQFGIHDGLPSNFINAIEIWDGYVWIGTNDGVSYINPKDLRKDYPKIPIKLEQITINGESRSLEEESLKLKNDENTIGLKLTAISYLINAKDDIYRYRLVGFDDRKEWAYTNDRNIQFVDLLPGNYTFEAAARNKINQWSDPALNITFQIKPHFLQTNWFKLLVVLFAFFLFALFFKFRERQIERNNVLQQGLLQANMRAKEHELSALRNQMNPHFVFNSLNAIQSFIFNNKGERANYYLSIFSRLMRDSLKFSRLKYISLKEEINFLKSYLELEQMRFAGKFDYQIIVEEGISLKHYAIPALLFQPIFENAIKHAFKDIDYKGILKMQIKEPQEEGILRVSIEDNGSGFTGEILINGKDEKNTESLGLTIVKNRIELINAGSKDYQISFKIANLKELDARRSGVRVDFEIPIMSILEYHEA